MSTFVLTDPTLESCYTQTRIEDPVRFDTGEVRFTATVFTVYLDFWFALVEAIRFRFRVFPLRHYSDD